LDLGLDIINSIRGLHLEGDRLPSEAVKRQKYEFSRSDTRCENSRFYEDLHLVLGKDQSEGMVELYKNMLTGRLYLSSELSGGVFDEASRSLVRGVLINLLS
jgi:hypothetical protein